MLKYRVRGLNECNKINLNEMRRKNMQNDVDFSTLVKTVILILTLGSISYKQHLRMYNHFMER